MRRGVFITFEGTEGSGKSTQARLLYEWLTARSLPCIITREPGGTEVGEAIRSILLDPGHKELKGKTELLLIFAARAQLTGEIVLPALAAGKIVISDRFSDSTYAYQVYGRSLPERPTMLFNRFAAAGLKPNLTFLVDVELDRGLRRARELGQDRFEIESTAFHAKVREGYLRLARRAPGRIKLLDGNRDVEEIQHEVREKTRHLLLKKGYHL